MLQSNVKDSVRIQLVYKVGSDKRKRNHTRFHIFHIKDIGLTESFLRSENSYLCVRTTEEYSKFSHIYFLEKAFK